MTDALVREKIRKEISNAADPAAFGRNQYLAFAKGEIGQDRLMLVVGAVIEMAAEPTVLDLTASDRVSGYVSGMAQRIRLGEIAADTAAEDLSALLAEIRGGNSEWLEFTVLGAE